MSRKIDLGQLTQVVDIIRVESKEDVPIKWQDSNNETCIVICNKIEEEYLKLARKQSI